MRLTGSASAMEGPVRSLGGANTTVSTFPCTASGLGAPVRVQSAAALLHSAAVQRPVWRHVLLWLLCCTRSPCRAVAVVVHAQQPNAAVVPAPASPPQAEHAPSAEHRHSSAWCSHTAPVAGDTASRCWYMSALFTRSVRDPTRDVDSSCSAHHSTCTAISSCTQPRPSLLSRVTSSPCEAAGLTARRGCRRPACPHSPHSRP